MFEGGSFNGCGIMNGFKQKAGESWPDETGKMYHSFLSFMIRLLDLNATQNERCIDDIFGQIYSQAFE